MNPNKSIETSFRRRSAVTLLFTPPIFPSLILCSALSRLDCLALLPRRLLPAVDVNTSTPSILSRSTAHLALSEPSWSSPASSDRSSFSLSQNALFLPEAEQVSQGRERAPKKKYIGVPYRGTQRTEEQKNLFAPVDFPAGFRDSVPQLESTRRGREEKEKRGKAGESCGFPSPRRGGRTRRPSRHHILYISLVELNLGLVSRKKRRRQC